MERLREFVPIDEVESDVVRCAVNFPSWVDITRIGLDLQEVETLCRLAGIKSLTITSSDQEKSQSVPMVIGHDASGAAVGGFAESKTQTQALAISPHAQKEHEIFMRKQAEFIDVVLNLNNQAMMEKCARSPEAWANLLDQELCSALQSAGLKHLCAFGNEEKFALIMLVVFGIIGSFPSSLEDIAKYSAFFTAEMYVTFNVFSSYLFKKAGIDSRLSVINLAGAELDRAAIFYIRLLTKNLVQVIQSDQPQIAE